MNRELWQRPAETQVWRTPEVQSQNTYLQGLECRAECPVARVKKQEPIHSFTYHFRSPYNMPGTRGGSRDLQLNRTITVHEDLTDQRGRQTHRWSEYNVMDGLDIHAGTAPRLGPGGEVLNGFLKELQCEVLKRIHEHFPGKVGKRGGVWSYPEKMG